MIKKILLGILVLFIVALAVGFLLPTKIDVANDISIEAPISYVFEEINDLERWPAWSYRLADDPTLQINYSGRKSGSGASFSWENKKGYGRLKLVESLPDSSLATETFLTEKDTAKGYYKLKTIDDKTLLTIGVTSKNVTAPFNTWKAFLSGLKTKKSINHELEKIKEIAEARPVLTITVTEESLAPTYYISVNNKMSSKDWKEVLNQKNKMFDELTAVMEKTKASSNGSSFCFTIHDFQTIELICAVPISPDSKFPPEYPVSQLYSGSAVKGIHVGSHENVNNSHNEVKQYIDYKKFDMNGNPWEVYLQQSSDTSKWITEVYYPVK